MRNAGDHFIILPTKYSVQNYILSFYSGPPGPGEWGKAGARRQGPGRGCAAPAGSEAL